jgi:hypothetical protein
MIAEHDTGRTYFVLLMLDKHFSAAIFTREGNADIFQCGHYRIAILN